MDQIGLPQGSAMVYFANPMAMSFTGVGGFPC